MKSIAPPLVLFVLLLTAALAGAASESGISPERMTGFYGEQIDREIRLEHNKAELLKGDSSELQCGSQLYAAKADFFEENRESLIERMIEKDVGAEQHNIDYFLITSFFDTGPREKLAACELPGSPG